MKPTATTGLMAVRMENPALEIEDFERIVAQYRTRVLRFVFASVHDMDLAETLTHDCFWNAYRNRPAFRGDCSTQTWSSHSIRHNTRGHPSTRNRRATQQARPVAGTGGIEEGKLGTERN